MDLNVDMVGGQLLTTRAALARLDTLALHQNDRFRVTLWLLGRTGTADDPLHVTTLPEGLTEIVLAGRPASNLVEEDLLFSVADWEEVGDGETLHWEGVMNLNTAAIAAKFPADDPASRSLEVLVDLELRSADAQERQTILRQYPAQLTRDIYRGTEGVPADGDPVYPLPAEILTRAADGLHRKYGKTLLPIGTTDLEISFEPAFASGGAVVITGAVVEMISGSDRVAVTGVSAVGTYGFTVHLSASIPDSAVLHWEAAMPAVVVIP